MLWSSGSVRPARNLALWFCLAATQAAGQTAYITCQPDEALSVIDVANGAETARWDLPGKPAGIAVHQGHVFTVSPEDKTVRKHDASGKVLASAVLDGGPIGIALHPARGRLFVSDWYNARLWVLRMDTLALETELDTGAAPAGLSLSPNGRFLASADKEANQVSIFNAETLGLDHTLPVGTRPFGLRFDPEGRLWVGNVGSDDVSVLDPASGETLATLPVGDRPYGVAFAAGRAFVTNQYEDSVSVISLATLAPETKIAVGEYPEGIDASADGKRIVLANWFDNSISVIDPITLDVLYEASTCDGPRAFGTFLLEGGTP